MESKLLTRRARTAGPSRLSSRVAVANGGAIISNGSVPRKRATSARPAIGTGGTQAWATREHPGPEAENPGLATTVTPMSTAARGLHSAVEKGRFHQLKFLMDFGADLNLKNDRGEGILVTALRIPADRCRQKMFNLLLRLGATLEDPDPVSGRDVLLWACYLGRDDQVRRLLQVCPGDLHFSRRDHEGNTCLHYMVEAEKGDLVKLIACSMRRFGLSVDVADANGVTPYIHAKRLGFEEVQELLVSEGNASPSQFDLDELDLLGSSAMGESHVAESSKTGPRYNHNRIRYPVYQSLKSASATTSINSSFSSRRCFGTNKKSVRYSANSSYPRSSSTWSSRAIGSSEGSSSASSSQCASGHTWTMTAMGSGAKRAKGQRQRAQPRTCWVSSVGAEQEGSTGAVPCTSTPVASHSSGFFRSSGNGSSSTQSNGHNNTSSSQGRSRAAPLGIDVTWTESTQVLDSLNKDKSKDTQCQYQPYLQRKVDVPPASSLVDEQSPSVKNVGELFQFMSLQLTPNYRPKADPKNAYKAPPKAKPRAGSKGGSWGIVSLFSRLKAKSQRIKLQSKARQERRGSLASGSGKLLLGRMKEPLVVK